VVSAPLHDANGVVDLDAIEEAEERTRHARGHSDSSGARERDKRTG
jgi:hypothetical protein